MNKLVRLIIAYVDYYIGSATYCIMTLANLLMEGLITLTATVLETVNTLFFGRYALALDGRPVRRHTSCGKEFFVKEPSIVNEVLCHLRGKTILRDQTGIPLTDDTGKLVKTRK